MAVRVTKLTAPFGGWNTRDSVGLMRATDAIAMTNLIPDINGVSIRPGYVSFVELVSSSYPTQTLITWKTQHGERLIAAAPATSSDHRLYDISTGSATALKTGYVGSHWHGGVMNSRLGLVNGADQPQELSYAPGTGTIVRDMTITGGTPNPEAFNRIHIFKSRSYFSTGTEPAFWYSATGALGGALTRFPIDRVAETSGNVKDIKSWTRDGGSGPDDFFVLFLDTGETIVYQGSNPGDASDWFLVGRYKLGKIMTAEQYAGKIHVVTEEDYNVLPDDLITQGQRRPSKLSGAAKEAVKRDQSDNWQIFFDPERGWKIVNVPYASNREQHMLNTRTGGAWRADYPAYVWAKYGGELYFGGASATVYRVRDGDDNGSPINWSVQQAYTDFKSPTNKTVLNYRHIWLTEGDFTVGSGFAYDFDVKTFSQSGSFDASGPPWDTSPWNTTSWGVGHPIVQDWQNGGGWGQNVSALQSGTATNVARWIHSDYRLEFSRDSI